MVKMRDHSRVALKGGAAARIAEVVLIAHGNATGFVKIPLIKGHKGTTPEEIAKLQEDFLAGARQKFQETRAEVLGLFDGTQVIVRGCRVGRSQEAVDALAAFFGGQATVYAAKEYQAFTRREISSFDKDPRQAAIKAFDHLAMQGFVPKQIVVTDDEKVRWVAAHLPDRYVPESFFVDEADVDKVRHAGADDAAIQALKDYESAQLIGVDKWGVSKSARPEDAELDPMTANQIVTLAGERLVKLRRLEKDSPDDWRNIGEEAWWVLRCHNAWSRKPEAMQINLEKMDPIGGLWMPGLSYDINLLAMQAARRPDLKVFHSDAFASANLVMPAGQTSEVVEGGLEVQEGRTNQPSKPEAQPSSRFRGSGAAALPKQGEMKMGEDRISPNPVMPVPPLGVDLSIPGGRKAATALVMAPLAETDDEVELVLDPAPANIPLSQLLDEARVEAIARGQSLGEADQSFRVGCVLEATRVVQQSEAGLHEIDGLLQQLAQHCEALDATSLGNVEKSAQLVKELQSFSALAQDPRSEPSTVELHAALIAAAATLSAGLGDRLVDRDPFADAGQVARLEQRFGSLRATVEADFAAFAQAVGVLKK